MHQMTLLGPASAPWIPLPHLHLTRVCPDLQPLSPPEFLAYNSQAPTLPPHPRVIAE